MTWKIVYTGAAKKDAKKLAKSGLKSKAEKLLTLINVDPFQNPSSYEKLIGDLSGAYSRSINIQHRIVYQVITKRKVVKILRMWTHYE